MPQPAMRHRTLPPTQILRRQAPRPPWWHPLAFVTILALLAILRVSSQARVAELECENQRLQRLMLEQTTLHGELLREHTALTSHDRLWQYAISHGMVAPKSVRTLRVGTLPPAQVRWELPDERAPLAPDSGTRLTYSSGGASAAAGDRL